VVVDDLAQADLIHLVDGNHDPHVVVEDPQDVEGLPLPATSLCSIPITSPTPWPG
jgi:hypothetical protein